MRYEWKRFAEFSAGLFFRNIIFFLAIRNNLFSNPTINSVRLSKTEIRDRILNPKHTPTIEQQIRRSDVEDIITKATDKLVDKLIKKLKEKGKENLIGLIPIAP